jgi:hypothetical protein
MNLVLNGIEAMKDAGGVDHQIIRKPRMVKYCSLWPPVGAPIGSWAVREPLPTAPTALERKTRRGDIFIELGKGTFLKRFDSQASFPLDNALFL